MVLRGGGDEELARVHPTTKCPHPDANSSIETHHPAKSHWLLFPLAIEPLFLFFCPPLLEKEMSDRGGPLHHHISVDQPNLP